MRLLLVFVAESADRLDRILVSSRWDLLMTGVHDHTKREADVGDRYRLTRISFDVISGFGCLLAQGPPGPVIVGVLDEHGYSSSSVHNQLVRMVHRNLLTSEKLGRVSIYRLSERILSGFVDIAGDREAPTFEGSFHSALHSIPETARTLRDRFQYVARMLGYRQLRPGLLLSFTDLSHDLPPLEDALAALSLNDSRPGRGQPEQPALGLRTLMDRCNLEYYLRFDQQLLERAGSSSTFDLIEWLPSD